MEGTNDDYKKLSEYKNLTHKFDKMMKALYGQRGAQLDIDILASDEAQSFINAHAGILDSTFKQVRMTDKMRERLTRSNYIFSGIKTFHELNEAFPSLLDENGDRKPFERFLNDVRKIDETYNSNYLRAEYNFVQASAEMAAKWEQYSEDGDRYLLQYRTAHDDKVRPEHAALDRITLPMSDLFWESYYPPLSWNCRCSVVQVRRGKYEETPHNEAMSRGEEAFANNEKLNMFRFNSGIQGKTMPDYNPYTIKRCNDCDVAKGKLGLVNEIVDNQLCAACRLNHQCWRNTSRKEELKRIAHNKQEYDRLSKDKRYKDVEFNPENGALKATHLGHNEGTSEGMNLEKELARMLYDCGHSVILCDEQKKGRSGETLVSLDMILDGTRMDIASVTKNKDFYGSIICRKNKQLVKYNDRSDVHEKNNTLCMFFNDPSMFGAKKIRRGYQYMKQRAEKEPKLRHIICILRKEKGLEIQKFDF